MADLEAPPLWQQPRMWEMLERLQGTDAVQVLLHAAAYGLTGNEARFVADQLEGRAAARDKYPTLAAQAHFLYPPKLNREQSSSEATARYKQEVVQQLEHVHTLVDITGGMGVDDIFMAPAVEELLHIERDAVLSQMASYNFQLLGLRQVRTLCADSRAWLAAAEDKRYHLLYVDPARRDDQGRKVFGLEQSTPEVPDLMPQLRARAHHILVKASPMADVHRCVEQLQGADAVHVVAVKGECKELLFLCSTVGASPKISCVDLDEKGNVRSRFSFTYAEEQTAEPTYATQLGDYLFMPNAAVMKGAPYRLISKHYKVAALGAATHLYTGGEVLPHFPGRTFRILQQVRLNAAALRHLLPEGRVHLLCRNYPATTATLQKQLHVQEGGDLYLIATTWTGKKIGLLCRRMDT